MESKTRCLVLKYESLGGGEPYDDQKNFANTVKIIYNNIWHSYKLW